MPALPTLGFMMELYGTSMSLTLDAHRFLAQVERLKRLALNAEVVATRAAHGSEVFQTLAREIGAITSTAQATIGELQERSAEIADKAIRSASRARLVEKLQAALEIGVEGGTRDAAVRHLERLGGRIGEDVESISIALERAVAAMSDVWRIHVQLPMISTLMRIEAHRSGMAEPAMASNAEALLSLRDELSGLLESVEGKTTTTLGLLARIR